MMCVNGNVRQKVLQGATSGAQDSSIIEIRVTIYKIVIITIL